MLDNNILNRVKLLMEYDMSKTYSENKKTILENPALKVALGSVARNTLDDIIRAVPGGVRNTRGAIISSSDDLIRAAGKGLLSQATQGQIRVALLKNPALSANVRTQLIDDLLLNTKAASRYAGQTASEIEKKYVAAGFDRATSKEIGRRMAAHNKALLKGKVPPGGTTGTPKGTTGTRLGKGRTTVSTSRSVVERVTGLIAKGWAWSRLLKWGLGIGLTAWVLYSIWTATTGSSPTDDDGNVVPPPNPNPENSYRDCEGTEMISIGCKSSSVKQLQRCIGVNDDGTWGPLTQARMEELGLGGGISVSDIPQICKTKEEAEQEAAQQAYDRQYPIVQGSEDSLNFSSDANDTNIKVSVNSDVEDFS